jgi:hypothetical protein
MRALLTEGVSLRGHGQNSPFPFSSKEPNSKELWCSYIDFLRPLLIVFNATLFLVWIDAFFEMIHD